MRPPVSFDIDAQGETDTRLQQLSTVVSDVQYSDRPALTVGTTSLSYQELHDRIDRTRGAFTNLGLEPGDRIILLLPTGVEFVVAYFAAHRAGLTVIALNPVLGVSEIDYILTSMQPKLILTVSERGVVPVLSQLPDIVISRVPSANIAYMGSASDFESFSEQELPLELYMSDVNHHHPVEVRHDEQEALILFTSGTSGRPKGVSLTHGALIRNVQAANCALDIRPDDVLLCPLPLAHVFGQLVLMLGGLLANAQLVLVPRPSPESVFEAMVKWEPTVMAAVPTTYSALTSLAAMHRESAQKAGRHLRVALSGGSGLAESVSNGFKAGFGRPIHQGYGMTEVGCCIALEDTSKPSSGGVGTILPTIEWRIAALEPSEPDSGELEIRGENIFQGYYVDGVFQPRARNEWFATGDLGRVDKEGRLFLFDRRKELIIRNGYNVYPSEVEAVLMEHPDVTLAAVVGVDDEFVGQEIAAFVTLRTGALVDAWEVVQWCKQKIALYKYPRKVAIIESMPTNPTGKILKRDLNLTLLQALS
ncbi:long-chain fatty acid--CoA ligase [Aestuariicella hydrocarbonica]|uniref:Long-chain fatty acid--CoA ligase n=1 Tax=Pseudomaricurvus hydrocarbonicus TaxID=1470433 RepID=A0A9E5JTJ4_9GAMM|nr:AMP-binding protein [Aestuariicella hydrocarbonica]NHO64271.1 long-chain fatty acid--CoA ligase [Aestuariicella hydrocarbonica]